MPFAMILLLSLFSLPLSCADKVSFDFDHSNLDACLQIPASMGDQAVLRSVLTSCKGASDIETIHRTVSMLRGYGYDDKLAYAWRSPEEVVKSRKTSSCADFGITAAALLRLNGIPAVIVKSMDVDWIWAFKSKSPTLTEWKGHVFLEVFLDGKWCLLDPVQGIIYRNYNNNARIFPGNRFAYHKGLDPKEMVMSLQWEEWKRQTTEYFISLDESLLPVPPGTTLLPSALILAHNPGYVSLQQLAIDQGFTIIGTTNTDFERHFSTFGEGAIFIEKGLEQNASLADMLNKFFPTWKQKYKRGVSSQRLDYGKIQIYIIDTTKLKNRNSLPRSLN